MLYQHASALEPSAAGCPSDNIVKITAGDACRFNDVTVACGSLGPRLVTLHVALTCDIHVHVDRSSTYEVVSSAPRSLRDAGYLKVGFVNFEGS